MSNPASNIKNYDKLNAQTPLGDAQNPDATILTRNAKLPANLTQGSSSGAIIHDSNLTTPLGIAPIRGPVTNQELSTRISNMHGAFEKGLNYNKYSPDNLPFLDNNQAMAFNQTFNSPVISEIIKDAQSNTLNAAGLTGSIPNNLNLFQKNQASKQINKARNSIISDNKIIQAQKQLMAAEEFFYRVISEKCPNNVDNQVCKSFKNLQSDLLEKKINNMILKNTEINKKITQEIIIYNQQIIAFIRLKELLATRIEELSELENNLNSLTTSIRNNTRSNFYEGKANNSARESQIILIFIYYQILILYLFISNFFPNENYKKIIPLILVILYIIFPIILQYLVVIVSNFIFFLQKKFGTHFKNLQLINNNT